MYLYRDRKLHAVYSYHLAYVRAAVMLHEQHQYYRSVTHSEPLYVCILGLIAHENGK